MSQKEWLPNGWVIAKVGDYLFLKNGFAFKSNSYVQPNDVTYPVIRISDIDGMYASDADAIHVSDPVVGFEVCKGDLLIAMSGATTGKIGVYKGKEPAFQNQRVGNLKLRSDKLGSTRFRNYLIASLSENILKEAYGGAQPNISGKAIENMEIQLPPLVEQKIIADKLDTLLAQVESIKARLESIPEILKQFRQSVLAAAVSGKLTEEWRRINTNHVRQDIYFIDKYWENEYKKNNKKYKKIEYPKSDFDLSVFPDNWVKTNVGRVFDVYVGATPSRQREEFWNGEINWVSSSEVAFCRIRSTKENITNEGYKSTSTTIHPVGTVMLAMIGQGKTRGQAAILDIEACHNQNTAALRVPEKIANSEFLYFYLLYKYEETRQMGSGNNQQAMNKAIVQGLEFPLPPFEEQIEIVDKIESLFEYIERVERQVQVALDRVSNLTQSILAKAFRGELTAEWRETNPELISGEHSAEALLGRIKAERELAKPATKRGRGKA